MTRTSIAPQQADFLLSIPPQYIGKKLEVLLYAVEEVTEAAPEASTMAQFWGIISPETGHDLQQRTENPTPKPRPTPAGPAAPRRGPGPAANLRPSG